MQHYLAPRLTTHGVLVEVYGEGLLLMGDSGIGKSETALELIKRGHRLIADDAVEIKRISRKTLVGTAPELIRYYMELRGIGVINVRHIYGVGAVKAGGRHRPFVRDGAVGRRKAYDRLGLIDEDGGHTRRQPAARDGARAPRQEPCRYHGAGCRMNNRQKKMGYNAAETLTAGTTAP